MTYQSVKVSFEGFYQRRKFKRKRYQNTEITTEPEDLRSLEIVIFARFKKKHIGRFPFDQNFRNFRNGDKWYRNFQGKVPENPEIVEFPKSEPFNRKFWNFREENQMERKFPGKYVRKFGYTS